MAAIRAIFNGHAFVPSEPISLPAQSEALILVGSAVGKRELDNAMRLYYQAGADADDEAWSRAVADQSRRAWDED